MCPLNREGRCLLYAFRPMICRLHGIPHELRPPGRPVSYGPGCRLFSERHGRQPYVAFDRSPLYARMAGLEQEIRRALGFGARLKLTIAVHGSALPDGSYGGNPTGFLLTIQGKKIYHACDTGLFYDMKLIGEEGIDLAILPIGDNFTMGPDDALRAVKLIEPKQVVPIHYDTFDVIKQDPVAWATRVEQETSTRATVMKPGDLLEL